MQIGLPFQLAECSRPANSFGRASPCALSDLDSCTQTPEALDSIVNDRQYPERIGIYREKLRGGGYWYQTERRQDLTDRTTVGGAARLV